MFIINEVETSHSFDINSVVFHFDDFNYGRRTAATRKKWTPEWNSVVIKNHVRDVQHWKILLLYILYPNFL